MTEYIVRESGYPGTIKKEIVGELVRCSDCKWHTDNFCNNFNGIGFGNDDFCSLGKRREENAEIR